MQCPNKYSVAILYSHVHQQQLTIDIREQEYISRYNRTAAVRLQVGAIDLPNPLRPCPTRSSDDLLGLQQNLSVVMCLPVLTTALRLTPLTTHW
jgi:hypothetical protein